MSRLGAMLGAPWVAVTGWSRGLIAFITLTTSLAAVLAFFAMGGHDGTVLCAVLAGITVVAWWLLVIPNAAWVARDATALKLPHIRRSASHGVWCYAALTVLLPTLLLAAALGHPLAWLVVFASLAATSMAFLLLPWVLMFALIIGQSVVINAHIVHLGQPSLSGAASWLIAPTVVLVTLDVWLWRRLLDRRTADDSHWLRPTLLNFREQSRRGWAGMRGRGADAAMTRSVPALLAPAFNLAATGPAHPVPSVRVLLGRRTTPQTWTSHARQWLFGVVVFVLVGVVPNVLIYRNDNAHRLLEALRSSLVIGALFPMLLACLAIAGMVLVVAWPLQARWKVASAELSMLALLPRLGPPDARRWAVLRAIHSRALLGMLVALLALYGLGAMQHTLGPMLVYAPLCLAGGALLAIAITLGTLAGRPLSVWAVGSSAAGVLTLACLTLAIVVDGASWRAWCLATWVVVLVLLARLVLRSWRALKRRPHPFLANPG